MAKNIQDLLNQIEKLNLEYLASRESAYDKDIEKVIKWIMAEAQAFAIKKDYDFNNRIAISREINTLFEAFSSINQKYVEGLDSNFDVISKIFDILDIPFDRTRSDAQMLAAAQADIMNKLESLKSMWANELTSYISSIKFREVSDADILKDIQQLLIGGTDRRGRPLVTYAQTFTSDAINEFNSSANVKKGRDAGLTTWWYYGDIIRDSRQFCKDHAGKFLSNEDIDKIQKQLDSGGWKGAKPGDFYIVRGGYQCRHHLQAAKEEWLKDLF